MQRCLGVAAIFSLLFLKVACSSLDKSQALPKMELTADLEEGAAPEDLTEGRYLNVKKQARLEEGAEKPVVIYWARLELEVVNLAEKLGEVETYVKSLGGFLERSNQREDTAELTLRVPVASFNQAVEFLSGVGRLLNREISAADISKEYHDLEIRLANDKAVRERLYLLLQKETNIEEKVKILQEIERLNSAIEKAQLQLKWLAQRAAFSTIVCHFKLLKPSEAIYLPSPFSWVSQLKAEKRTIKDYRDISLPVPENFFNYEKAFKQKKSDALFISPQGVKVRAGLVDNEPKADIAFWQTALVKEMLLRGYELESEGKSFVFCLRRDFARHYYQISLWVTEKSIFVIEAFYPSETAWRELHFTVAKSIEGAKINE